MLRATDHECRVVLSDVKQRSVMRDEELRLPVDRAEDEDFIIRILGGWGAVSVTIVDLTQTSPTDTE